MARRKRKRVRTQRISRKLAHALIAAVERQHKKRGVACKSRREYSKEK